MYRRYFRSDACTRLSNFIYRRMVSADWTSAFLPPPQGCARGPPPTLCAPPQVQKYLMGLQKNLPPMAVLDRTWPPAPYKFLSDANQELKSIFYRWKVGVGGGLPASPSQWGCGGTASPRPPSLQCKKYREQLTPQQRAMLQAKLCASELFKDKKALYAQRCGHTRWAGGKRGGLS